MISYERTSRYARTDLFQSCSMERQKSTKNTLTLCWICLRCRPKKNQKVRNACEDRVSIKKKKSVIDQAMNQDVDKKLNQKT